MGTVIALQTTKLCQFFRGNEPTDQWLEINWQGHLSCSCGAGTLLLSSKTLIGCEKEISHGSRNIPDVVSFIQGHISNLELALADFPVQRR